MAFELAVKLTTVRTLRIWLGDGGQEGKRACVDAMTNTEVSASSNILDTTLKGRRSKNFVYRKEKRGGKAELIDSRTLCLFLECVRSRIRPVSVP